MKKLALGAAPLCYSTAPALTTILNCIRIRSLLHLQQVYSEGSPLGCSSQADDGSRSRPISR
jgi:hypothetical protein